MNDYSLKLQKASCEKNVLGILENLWNLSKKSLVQK